LQTATESCLHPGARLLSRAQDRIAAAVTNQRPFFGITNKQTSIYIPACQVRSHIEFTRVSWGPNLFRNAEESQFIAKLGMTAPMRQHCRFDRFMPAFQFDRSQSQQESG